MQYDSRQRRWNTVFVKQSVKIRKRESLKAKRWLNILKRALPIK